MNKLKQTHNEIMAKVYKWIYFEKMHNIFKNQIVKLIRLLECTMMGIKLHGKILFKMLWMLRMQIMEINSTFLSLL